MAMANKANEVMDGENYNPFYRSVQCIAIKF